MWVVNLKIIGVRLAQIMNDRSKGYIYLLKSDDKIKIGFSKNVKKRVRQLSRWDGELELITVIKGTIHLEKKFHSFLRSQGEYFGDEWYPQYRLEEIKTHMMVLNDGSLK